MTLKNNTKNTVSTSVDNTVLTGVVSVLRNNKTWSGTMTDLNSALVKVLGKKSSQVLPGSPSALRVVLNRVVNKLRNKKISVKFARTPDHTRTRLVRFAR